MNTEKMIKNREITFSLSLNLLNFSSSAIRRASACYCILNYENDALSYPLSKKLLVRLFSDPSELVLPRIPLDERDLDLPGLLKLSGKACWFICLSGELDILLVEFIIYNQ